MSTLYEQMGYKALKLFSLDQIAQWLAFLRHNKQMKEVRDQNEQINALERIIDDFMKAEQELIKGN